MAPLPSLVRVDRQGRVEPLGGAWPPADYFYPRFSPDGGRVAVAIRDALDLDLWVLDLARGSRTRITFGGINALFPVWSPDGSALAFANGNHPTNSLMMASLDGSGHIETLFESDQRVFPTSWRPDGEALAFYVVDQETQRDLRMLRLEEDAGTEVPFLTTPFQELAGAFSPNGRWLAYVSDKSGRNDVYVRPSSGRGPEYVVSTSGGQEPVWAPNGRALFYRLGGEILVADVELGETFQATAPRPLFSGNYFAAGERFIASRSPFYDVAPDGESFVMVQRPTSSELDTAEIVAVINWHEELDRHVPVN